MVCPDCTSQNVSQSSSDGSETWYECHECGLVFAEAADDDYVLDDCEFFGHDWMTRDLPDGYSFAECQRCGLIDD